jgi:hypothetical protein
MGKVEIFCGGGAVAFQFTIFYQRMKENTLEYYFENASLGCLENSCACDGRRVNKWQ